MKFFSSKLPYLQQLITLFSEEVSMQNLIRQSTLFTCRDLLEILIMGSLWIIVILCRLYCDQF